MCSSPAAQCKAVTMDVLIREFVDEACSLLDEVEAALSLRAPLRQEMTPIIHRALHTIKGNAGLLSLADVATAAHEAETAFDAIQANSAALETFDVAVLRLRSTILSLANPEAEPSTRSSVGASVRVGSERLDQIHRDAFELILWRNRFAETLKQHSDQQWREPLQQLTRVVNDLQSNVSAAMLRKLDHTWSTLPRMMREAAALHGIRVEMECIGGDTEVDRATADIIVDCVVHLARNCVAHGIEAADERLSKGKPVDGQIKLCAWQTDTHTLVSVGDDGRGLAQPVQQAFEPGCSTAVGVSELAGRGEGLSIVKRLIERAGGTVGIESARGAGTLVTLRIPHSANVVECLLIAVGDQRFAVPYRQLTEIVPSSNSDTNPRLKHLPIVDLRERLAAKGGRQCVPKIAICDAAGVAVKFDDVLHSDKLVVLPTPKPLAGISHIGGVAMLGDGMPVIVLHVPGLVKGHDLPLSCEAANAVQDNASGLRRWPLLASEKKALPLSGAEHGRNVVLLCDPHDQLDVLLRPVVEATGLQLETCVQKIPPDFTAYLAVILDLQDQSDGWLELVKARLGACQGAPTVIAVAGQPDAAIRRVARWLGVSSLINAFDRRRLLNLLTQSSVDGMAA